MSGGYRCLRCGERLFAHGSHAPSLFRCADGAEVPWSTFRNGAGVERVTCDDLGCVDGMTIQGRKYEADGRTEDQWAPCGRRADTCSTPDGSTS